MTLTRVSRLLVLALCLVLAPAILPSCEEAAEGSRPGECSDGVDNDGDSIVDCEDPDCYAEADCTGADDDSSAGDDDSTADDDAGDDDLGDDDLGDDDLGDDDEGDDDEDDD